MRSRTRSTYSLIVLVALAVVASPAGAAGAGPFGAGDAVDLLASSTDGTSAIQAAESFGLVEYLPRTGDGLPAGVAPSRDESGLSASPPDAAEVSISSRGLPLGGIALLVPMLFGMVALAKDRDTPSREGRVLDYLVGAAVEIFAGALVVAENGYAVPGKAAAGLVTLGRANTHVDNSDGAAGDETVFVERGVFRFANAGDITQADVGADAYVVDDQTVSADDDSGARSLAGVIRGLDAAGVWVEI